MPFLNHNFETLKVSVCDRVALVTMANPPVNAMSQVMSDELTLVMDLITNLDDVHAVVLTGAGKVFCAGADLKTRATSMAAPGGLPALSRRSRECFHAIRECSKPVVAAVNGAALGSGLAIVASSDVIFASTDAVIGLPEIDVGLLGGCRHAMRLFGHSRLRRMALTGYRVPAEELYRQGIIEECVPSDELLSVSMAFAQLIASKSPTSIRMSKHTLNVIEDMSLRDGYRYEQDMTAQLALSEDAAEAQLAFKEKRAPNFVGR